MSGTVRYHALAILAMAAVVSLDVACQRVALLAPTGSTVTLTVDRNVLPINGQTTLRAVVIESAGTPVHNGTTVTFAATLGSVSPQSVETKDGIATAIFNAGTISGTSSVRAFSGGAVSSNGSAGGIEIKIGAAAAGSVAISATPPAVSQSGGTVTISALVMDANNNPLSGASVLFSATNGVLSAPTALSDDSGVAKVTLTTQSTTTVTATVGASKASVEVTASTAPTITISDPSPSTVVAGQPMTFTVTVTSGGSGNNTPRQVQTLDVQFGDGTRETRSNVTGAVGFSHTYQQQGGYTITATATDTNNNTGIASKAIIVGFASQPTVTLSASPNPVPAADQGQTTFTVNAQAGSTSAPPVRSVRVTLQDGTVIYNSTSSGSQQFAYKFGGGGTYTATATVTDAAGNTGSTTAVVTVRPW